MGNIFLRLNRPKSFAEISTVHRLSRKKHEEDGPFSKILRRFRREIIVSKERLDGQLLSAYEIELVRNSWNNITPNRELFGCKVYEWIFEEEPCMKFLFLWDDVPTEGLHTNVDFQNQARSIMGAIDKVVQNVENFEIEIKPYLYDLGQRHTKFRGFGFSPNHWELFRESILMRLNETVSMQFKDRSILMEAWRVLMQSIIDTMKAGYDNSVQKQHIFMKDAYSVRLNMEQHTQSSTKGKTQKTRHSLGCEELDLPSPAMKNVKRWSTGGKCKQGHSQRVPRKKRLSSGETVSSKGSSASLERILRRL